MGYQKDRLLEEDDQGWKFSARGICVECISDSYLQQVVENNLKEKKCDFCGCVAKKAPIAAPFDSVMRVIHDTVTQYWAHASGEPIAWDQEEGSYAGDTWDTWDLVHDVIPFPPSEKENVLEYIVDRLGNETWCEKSPYSLTGAKHYSYSWDTFCHAVKHETRYFFSSMPSDEFAEHIPVSQMLDKLSEMIAGAQIETTLPADTQFHRFRVHKARERCVTWDALGSPPPERCVSNRMSAAGISVFYAGMDFETAHAETAANLKRTDPRVLTVGVWTNTRPLKVLDLSKFPAIPEFYQIPRYDRDPIVFLNHFVEEIRNPVKHDGHEHIDYVPTQILTEYLQRSYRALDNRPLDGIIYKSAQRRRGRSIVIFASHRDLDPDGFLTWGGGQPILKLDPASVRKVKRGY
jgi:hypothetical protein